MTEYRLRTATVTSEVHRHHGPSTVEIPDNAVALDVEYTDPVGMDTPRHEAKVRYLEPVDDGDDGGDDE